MGHRINGHGRGCLTIRAAQWVTCDYQSSTSRILNQTEIDGIFFFLFHQFQEFQLVNLVENLFNAVPNTVTEIL